VSIRNRATGAVVLGAGLRDRGSSVCLVCFSLVLGSPARPSGYARLVRRNPVPLAVAMAVVGGRTNLAKSPRLKTLARSSSVGYTFVYSSRPM